MHYTSRATGRFGLLLIAYLAFIGLGLPDAITGVAWPSMRRSFDLKQSGLGLFLALTAGSYLVSSALTGAALRRMRVGTLLALSCFTAVSGLVGWAFAPSWHVVLACAPLLGFSGGAIDSTLNLVAATRFGARQMNWLHASYGVGATLGPLIMTVALTAPGGSWRFGVAAVAAVLAALGLLHLLTRRAWNESNADAPSATPPSSNAAPSPTMIGTLGRGALWLQIAAFVAITGFEATAGQWSFAVLAEARGVDTATAGMLVGAYWASFTISRVLAGLFVDRFGSVHLTRVATLVALAGAALFAIDLGTTPNAAGLVLAGLGVAPLFPGLMAETPRRLGPATAAHAIGFQVSGAILGAAAAPALAGLLAERMGVGAAAGVLLVLGLSLVLLNELLVAALDRD